MIHARLAALGLPLSTLDQLNPTVMPLFLLPEDTLIREYFPVDRAEEVWKKSVLGWGLDPEILDSITIDSYPRENKYSHAYTMGVVPRTPKAIMVDSDLSLSALGSG